MSTTPPDDDDAFRWEGDEDERAVRTRRRRAKARVAVDETSVTGQPAAEPDVHEDLADDEGDAAAEQDLDADAPGLSSIEIVLLGILGGIALLETIGWVRADLRLPFTTDVTTGLTATVFLPYVLEIVGRIAAVLAAPLWFCVVLWRIPSGPRRFAWMSIGALLLLPWPVLVSAA